MTLFHKPKSRKSHALLVEAVDEGDGALIIYGRWWDLSNSLHPMQMNLLPYIERLTHKAWLEGFDRLLLTVPNE